MTVSCPTIDELTQSSKVAQDYNIGQIYSL
jgi:hypothetical protein